jgi:hypothetical protein
MLPLAGLLASAPAQAPATRFPIASPSILSAMQQKQMPVSGVQLRLAAPITASVEAPVLEVRLLTPGDKHSAQLLVACRNSAECLPFYVSASWPVEVDVATLHNGFVHATGATHDVVDRSSSDDTNTLRAGSSATLLLDGERVHVTLRVVCLDGGEPGEKVRVTTLDRRQSYVARVISPGVLRGNF